MTPQPPGHQTAGAGENVLHLFGLPLQNTTLALAADMLLRAAAQGQRRNVYFVNAHCVNLAAANADYDETLRAADLLFADGIGMRIAARVAGDRVRDNVNGTDLFPLLCAGAAQAGLALAFIGGKPGVAQACARNMGIAHPGLKVAYVQDGYFPAAQTDAVLHALRQSQAQLVFVAMGVPRQEQFIRRHAEALGDTVRLGVGALFDFYSGTIPRAPRVLRRLGLEWLFRLLIEPRRLFVRYVLGNPQFLARVLWRRLRKHAALTHEPLSG
ncbi:MAG: WecB/TagA/CpsF family glycosyltransferase [Burkholderiaceae bacterium]|jgi:N-acetylglucosaminyldiphosphoundecaprenol N-acetyl-beta-D-mannosaminyltransferase|nr:WecB/TagA/CpsF family glycosyltransferase [Burkholderiaceae bacterium]